MNYAPLSSLKIRKRNHARQIEITQMFFRSLIEPSLPIYEGNYTETQRKEHPRIYLFWNFAEKPCGGLQESYESLMANLQLMENNFEKSNIWKWISETCHTATCTSLTNVLTPWLTVKLFWPRWAKALYVLWEMRLLGTGCYTQAARYPAWENKPSNYDFDTWL